MHMSANSLARRRLERQIIEDGTAIWKTKKEVDALLDAEDKKQQWIMLATYNPWGKPGYGAPMPGALRKTKWILNGPTEDDDVNTAITLGRPGHGAPLRTSSGKTKTYVTADPLIRFQLHDSARRAVENNLRYRATPNDKENYRKELDAIVCQKKKKPTEGGPGLPCNRHEGWTNNSMFNKLAKDNSHEREQMYEISGGGVELVPLMAKHRMSIRRPLPTTDVTRMSRISDDLPKMRNEGPEYFRQLCHQVHEKEAQKQKEQKEEVIESQKHFETWKGFWGRPGHGAPKALSQREKLEFLLYRIPTRRITSYTTKSPIKKTS